MLWKVGIQRALLFCQARMNVSIYELCFSSGWLKVAISTREVMLLSGLSQSKHMMSQPCRHLPVLETKKQTAVGRCNIPSHAKSSGLQESTVSTRMYAYGGEAWYFTHLWGQRVVVNGNNMLLLKLQSSFYCLLFSPNRTGFKLEVQIFMLYLFKILCISKSHLKKWSSSICG